MKATIVIKDILIAIVSIFLSTIFMEVSISGEYYSRSEILLDAFNLSIVYCMPFGVLWGYLFRVSEQYFRHAVKYSHFEKPVMIFLFVGMTFFFGFILVLCDFEKMHVLIVFHLAGMMSCLAHVLCSILKAGPTV